MSKIKDMGIDINSIVEDDEPEKVESESKKEEVLIGEQEVPSMGSSGWTDYIINQLSDTEVYTLEEGDDTKKHPTVAGLRRIVNSMFEIVESTTNVVNVLPTPNGIPIVTVEHHIVVYPKNNANKVESKWSGCGSAGPHNIPNNMAYPAELAETRAKGRAYTNLLSLSVCTKDEINKIGFKVPNKVTFAQRKQLETFCKTLDIDLLKFIKQGSGKYDRVEDITLNDLSKMFEYLNRVQQGLYNRSLDQKDADVYEKVRKRK